MRLKKKSLNHIFKSCLLLLLATVGHDNKQGDLSPAAGRIPRGRGLAALSSSFAPAVRVAGLASQLLPVLLPGPKAVLFGVSEQKDDPDCETHVSS